MPVIADIQLLCSHLKTKQLILITCAVLLGASVGLLLILLKYWHNLATPLYLLRTSWHLGILGRESQFYNEKYPPPRSPSKLAGKQNLIVLYYLCSISHYFFCMSGNLPDYLWWNIFLFNWLNFYSSLPKRPPPSHPNSKILN